MVVSHMRLSDLVAFDGRCMCMIFHSDILNFFAEVNVFQLAPIARSIR
jgi:hypothetical protein